MIDHVVWSIVVMSPAKVFLQDCNNAIPMKVVKSKDFIGKYLPEEVRLTNDYLFLTLILFFFLSI
jgi:hypothetical protein